MYVGVDSGGSLTRVTIGDGRSAPQTTTVAGSLNPVASGAEADFSRLVIDPIMQDFGHDPPWVSIVVGSAGYGASASPLTTSYVATALARLARFRLLVLNDVDPLVLGRHRVGSGAIVLGTGSCAVALSDDAIVRVGGVEYVGSDQGGATFLGQQGLIGAVKASDGRGPKTLLMARISEHFGMDIAATARRIAESPRPKPLLAALAPIVLRCAYIEGDAIASEVVGRALDEVLEMLDAIALRCPASRHGFWKCTGGLLAHSAEYRADVERVASERGLVMGFVESAAIDCYEMARDPAGVPSFVNSYLVER